MTHAERTPATRVSRSSIQSLNHTMQHSGTHNRQQPLRIAARRAEYEQEGWKRFDPAASAYTTEQVVTERKRRVVSVS